MGDLGVMTVDFVHMELAATLAPHCVRCSVGERGNPSQLIVTERRKAFNGGASPGEERHCNQHRC